MRFRRMVTMAGLAYGAYSMYKRYNSNRSAETSTPEMGSQAPATGRSMP